ncbi:MAG: response regulator transcription factor [Saprospiraceae bacterium]|nr:response regulator transcription factor [Saprospiraceae bacterium]
MKIVIIEDEQPAATRLCSLIKQLQPEAEFFPVLDTVEAAAAFFRQSHEHDLIFMDIHLADGNSFEIFRLSNIQKPVIFTTAYDQYALEAFKVYSLDYLLKPVKSEELRAVFEKYKRHYTHQSLPQTNLPDEAALQEKRYLIKIGQKIEILPYEEVAFYYTKEKLTFAVNFRGQRFPLEYTLDHIMQHMAGSDYFRINRQYIVHRKAIQSMSAATKSRVKLQLIHPTGEEVIVSVERSPEFKKWVKR